MLIDKDGFLKVSGKNDSDHNTISIHLNIPQIQRQVCIKQTGWNLKAGEEKWKDFSNQLRLRTEKNTQIITT